MKFFEKLATLGEQLQTIPKVLENLTSAISAAAERIANTSNKISAEVSLSEAVERQRTTEQNRQATIQWWVAAGTWAAVIAASAYATISYFQWKEMQKQNVNSVRAWVGLDQQITIDALEMSPQLAADLHYSIKNFGHGPAFKVVTTGFFETDMKTFDGTAQFVCESAVHFATGTVPMSPELHNPGPMGYVLFPDQLHQQIDRWRGQGVPGATHFRYIGCVAYLDQFKNVHWTRFCMEPELSGQPMNQNVRLAFCSLYNDTDETATRNFAGKHK
jgi:hypothetical protein